MPTAPALKLMPPASVVRHLSPVPEHPRDRTRVSYSDARLWFRIGICLFRYLTDQMPGGPASQPLKLQVVEKNTHPARPYKAAPGVILALWCWKYYKEMSDAGCRGKGNSSSPFYLLVNCLNPASAFWQKASVRCQWSRIIPVISTLSVF